MNVEGLDCSLGLDIVSELVVSRTGFNPDDLFIARACPGCGKQPADVSAVDLTGNGRFKVAISGPSRVPVDLPGTELLYCKCGSCGSFYSVVMFGPLAHEGEVLTEYLIVQEDQFLVKIVRELEVRVREGTVPEDVNKWISSRLTCSIDSALAMMDNQLWLVSTCWNESRYRKKWVF